MTIEFYDYESDFGEFALKVLKTVRGSDYDKTTSLDVAEFQIKEYMDDMRKQVKKRVSKRKRLSVL